MLEGGKTEREQYFAFLRSGGSKYPLESLKAAGVDMSRPEPVRTALQTVGELIDRLEAGLFPG